MKKNILFILAFCCLSSISCGYTTSSALPADFRLIHVEAFKNSIVYASEERLNTYFPLIELDVKNAIIDRFLFDGNLRIAEESNADLILRGELTGYDRIPLRYTDDDDVKEYRIQIVVNLKLFNTKYDELLWAENGFVGESTYYVSGPAATDESSAIAEATLDLARRIVERTIENW